MSCCYGKGIYYTSCVQPPNKVTISKMRSTSSTMMKLNKIKDIARHLLKNEDDISSMAVLANWKLVKKLFMKNKNT
jgi:hypothetical protein